MPYHFTVFIHYCQRLLYDNDPVHSSPYCFTVLIHQFHGLLYDQPGQSSEVERNPKMSILFFWLERGGGWGSSPLTSPTNHQKLNVIQKKHQKLLKLASTFSFLGGGYISQYQNVTLTCIPLFHLGGGYISQNQNVTLTCIQLFHSGGVHQPEPKCHFDLYPTFSFWGGTSARTKM